MKHSKPSFESLYRLNIFSYSISYDIGRIRMPGSNNLLRLRNFIEFEFKRTITSYIERTACCNDLNEMTDRYPVVKLTSRDLGKTSEKASSNSVDT